MVKVRGRDGKAWGQVLNLDSALLNNAGRSDGMTLAAYSLSELPDICPEFQTNFLA